MSRGVKHLLANILHKTINASLICSNFKHRYNLTDYGYYCYSGKYRYVIDALVVTININDSKISYEKEAIYIKINKEYMWQPDKDIFSMHDNIGEVLLMHYRNGVWNVVGHRCTMHHKLANPTDLWLSIQEIAAWVLNQPELVRIIEMANQ
jgi:hypothetical protein